jgi:hypothetical protein
MTRLGHFIALGGLIGVVACGGSANDGASPARKAVFSGSYNAGGDNSGAPSMVADASSAGPAEKKIEKTFEAPVATQRYVWSANPKTGRVALIDAATFQIQTVEAGDMPTWVAAVPGQEDRVLVINVGSSDASLLTSGPNGIAERRYRLHAGANSWSVSDDGHFAIAWTDTARVAAAMGPDASAANVDLSASFQDITVVDLTLPDVAGGANVPPRLTVGYRPVQIVFAHGKSRAYAVTADGIDVIDLGTQGSPQVASTIGYAPEPSATPPVPADGGQDAEAEVPEVEAPDADLEAGPDADAETSEVGVEAGASDAQTIDARAATPEAEAAPSVRANPEAPDVSITKDGTYATVRREGSAQLDVIDLMQGTHTPVVLAGPINDAALSPDGTSALAVIRSRAEVDVVPIPPTSIENIARLGIEGETIGRVIISDDGKLALLFTTAYPVERLVLLDIGAREVTGLDLHAPVQAVFPTHDATHAIVFHESYSGRAFTSPGAFSVVPLSADRAARIQPLGAPPKQVALAPDGTNAIVSARDDRTGKYLAYVAKMPSLMVDEVALASPPMAVGIVGKMGYVAQEHTEGRVTFIDRATGALHTVTGFELGASIFQWPARDGGQP